MKPFQKVIAVVLSAILLLSSVSCVPASLTKQWSYQYNDEVLSAKQDIGVYIYALYQAYNSAKTFAQDSKKYDESKSFMDIKITDDEGNKAIASEWIKEEAEKIALNIIATDYLAEKHEASWDEATIKNARDTAQKTWDVGAYASYGYYSPMSKELEPYGVSFESFFTSSYEADVKQTAIFKKLYDKGGEMEVSDKELTEFFVENYVNYSYIPVQMYTSTQDAEGNSTSKAFGKKKIKTIEKSLDKIADQINSGSLKSAKAFEKVQEENEVSAQSVVNEKVELFKDIETNNADIAKALKKLKNGKAVAITTGADGDTPTAYLIVKNDIKDSIKAYIKEDTNRTSVLSNCKKDDFVDFIEKTTKEISKSDALTANTAQLDRYDPDMFFVKPEETTSAEDVVVE